VAAFVQIPWMSQVGGMEAGSKLTTTPGLRLSLQSSAEPKSKIRQLYHAKMGGDGTCEGGPDLFRGSSEIHRRVIRSRRACVQPIQGALHSAAPSRMAEFKFNIQMGIVCWRASWHELQARFARSCLGRAFRPAATMEAPSLASAPIRVSKLRLRLRDSESSHFGYQLAPAGCVDDQRPPGWPHSVEPPGAPSVAKILCCLADD